MLNEKKPGTKDHIFYDSIYIKWAEQSVYRDRKLICVCLGLEGAWKGGVNANGYGLWG